MHPGGRIWCKRENASLYCVVYRCLQHNDGSLLQIWYVGRRRQEAVQSGLITNAMELTGALRGGQAGRLVKPVRTRAHGNGGMPRRRVHHAKKVERLPDR